MNLKIYPIQKFDRSLPDLFNFTGFHLILLCCLELNDEINLSVEPNRTTVFRGYNNLGVNLTMLTYFRKAECLSGRVLNVKWRVSGLSLKEDLYYVIA